jgi:hypothetical protein
MDTYRVAAASNCALRGHSGRWLPDPETVTALAQRLGKPRQGIDLYDTPPAGRVGRILQPGEFSSTRDDIDTHLVLSASRNPRLSRMVDAFGILKPQRLLFTKLDETSSFGPILNEAARTASRFLLRRDNAFRKILGLPPESIAGFGPDRAGCQGAVGGLVRGFKFAHVLEIACLRTRSDQSRDR